MCLRPAPADTGIIFRRTDVELGLGDIKAIHQNVTETNLCTTLGNNHGNRVSTVEHLMAAFYGCSIDNAIVELDGPEVPIMDGSAAPFLFLIESAGVQPLNLPRKAIRILKTVRVSDGDKWVELSPSNIPKVSFQIDFEANIIASQTYQITATPENFRAELARARTFGFVEEVEQLRAQGLAKGGSLDNAVVIEAGRVLNEGGLRYRDEFVRHKMLDAFGDLYLAGGPVIGRYSAMRSGHYLNHRLLSQLFSDPSAWAYMPCPENMGYSAQDRVQQRTSDELRHAVGG